MSCKRQLLLMSSSSLHGFEYLEHTKDIIKEILTKHCVETVLFIPYALRDYDDYTNTVEKTISQWGFNVEGIHTKPNAVDAVNGAEAIFIGGGNTFALLNSLYENNLIECIQNRVLSDGIPYMGSSAGTNVATKSIHTTNDMPVVYPPSFDALNLVPFNINPHYVETDPKTEHKGETRDQRLNEFMKYNNRAVLALREGTSLLVDNDKATMIGLYHSKLFRPNKDPLDIPPGTDLSFLLPE